MNLDKIASEASRLNPRERAILAEAIWESLEDPYFIPNDMTEKEALALAKQREEEIEQGKAVPLSHKELMNRLHK